MATVTILDLRRSDIRTHGYYGSYWIESANISPVAGDDLACVLFSFPATKYPRGKILIHEIAFQVTTLWAGGTVACTVGNPTLATDAVTTGGDATTVDLDEYIPNADLTLGTVGIYWAVSGDWITAKLLGTNTGPVVITPANTTVPTVTAYPSSDDTITGGAAKVFMKIEEVPFV